MNITDIKIKNTKNSINIIATVSIVLDDCFTVNNIKIVNGKNGIFVGMPSLKDENNDYYDVVYPINTKTREYIVQSVLSAYDSFRSEVVRQ